MTENNDLDLRRIRRALLSVSDKTGIVEFARELKAFAVEIISTGGTAAALRAAGLEVRDVADVTGFPEMMDGRIKTLHPRIHGALLALRDNADHQAAMHEHEIEPIDLVVVNLYPFQETVARKETTRAEAIEQIDIGGPAMIRSAAKNFTDVAVVVAPERYDDVLEELRSKDGALSLATRKRLALEAFMATSRYDRAVELYLFDSVVSDQAALPREAGHEGEAQSLPVQINLSFEKVGDLRYGENPHQLAAIYATEDGPPGVVQAKVLSGKEMSFNNYVDADAAWQLVYEFAQSACAIIKHTNPCGVGLGESTEDAYRKALACDPQSAFGGIVAFNRKLDEATARVITEIFTEVIIAPDYSEAALEILKFRMNLRVLRAEPPAINFEYKQVSGGMLVQTHDAHRLSSTELRVATRRAPSSREIADLLFAWTVCKHTKSNAIVYARDGQTVGVGAGQMSRVDSVKLGAMRAQLPVKDSVLASDAFFPFRDGIDEAAKQGISAVIQPGGSVKDVEVIAAADEHGLAMVFTGIRHFKH